MGERRPTTPQTGFRNTLRETKKERHTQRQRGDQLVHHTSVIGFRTMLPPLPVSSSSPKNILKLSGGPLELPLLPISPPAFRTGLDATPSWTVQILRQLSQLDGHLGAAGRGLNSQIRCINRMQGREPQMQLTSSPAPSLAQLWSLLCSCYSADSSLQQNLPWDELGCSLGQEGASIAVSSGSGPHRPSEPGPAGKAPCKVQTCLVFTFLGCLPA